VTARTPRVRLDPLRRRRASGQWVTKQRLGTRWPNALQMAELPPISIRARRYRAAFRGFGAGVGLGAGATTRSFSEMICSPPPPFGIP